MLIVSLKIKVTSHRQTYANGIHPPETAMDHDILPVFDRDLTSIVIPEHDDDEELRDKPDSENDDDNTISYYILIPEDLPDDHDQRIAVFEVARNPNRKRYRNADVVME
jgi:hypothetical protein